LRLSRRDKEGTPPHKPPSQPKRVNIADSDDTVDGRAPRFQITDLAASEVDQTCLEIFPQVASAFEDKAAGGHRLLHADHGKVSPAVGVAVADDRVRHDLDRGRELSHLRRDGGGDQVLTVAVAQEKEGRHGHHASPEASPVDKTARSWPNCWR